MKEMGALSCNIDAASWPERQCSEGSPVVLGVDVLPAAEGGQVPDPNFAPCSAVQRIAADLQPLHWLVVAPQCMQACARA